MNNILWYYTNPGVDGNGQPTMPVTDPGKLEMFNQLYRDAVESSSKSSSYYSTQEDYPGYGYAHSEAQGFAWDLVDTAIDLHLSCDIDADGMASISGYVSDAFYCDECIGPCYWSAHPVAGLPRAKTRWLTQHLVFSLKI